MGAEVTVVEVLPQILPVEDAEIAGLARKRFEKQGIKIMTGTKVTKLEKKSDSVVATIDDGKGKPQTAEFDRVISAVGVVGNIENLGLEKLGVKTERGCVVIDGSARPTCPASTPSVTLPDRRCLRTRPSMKAWSVSKPSKGMHPHPMDKLLIPGCTYCNPQIASVGLTEAKAKEGGRETFASAVFRLSATARRSRWAKTRAWSRWCSTRRPVNCSARTWSAPKSPN